MRTPTRSANGLERQPYRLEKHREDFSPARWRLCELAAGVGEDPALPRVPVPQYEMRRSPLRGGRGNDVHGDLYIVFGVKGMIIELRGARSTGGNGSPKMVIAYAYLEPP